MSDLAKSVIQSCLLNQYVFSKVRFDNAKDTNALLVAAQESQEAMLRAAQVYLANHIEELLIERLEQARKACKSKDIAIRIDGKLFILKEAEQ